MLLGGRVRAGSTLARNTGIAGIALLDKVHICELNLHQTAPKTRNLHCNLNHSTVSGMYTPALKGMLVRDLLL